MTIINDSYFRKQSNVIISNEDLLITNGLSHLSEEQKSSLIDLLATRFGMPHLEITDEFIFNHHKTLISEQFKQTCEDEILKGFLAFNGHTYRTNRDDQINMIGKKIQLENDLTIDIVKWKTEDAGYIDHSREEWLQVYKEAHKHKEDTLIKYDTYKLLLLNASTDEEILAVSWN